MPSARSVPRQQSFSIDSLDPDLVPLGDFAKTVPTRRKPRYRTVRRWAIIGCINRFTKQRIKLPVVRLPVGRCTTMAAYQWFIRQLNRET